MNSKPTLLDMPDIAMNIILRKCDFPSIMSLRKVCHNLRNFIDEANLDNFFDKFQIRINGTQIEFFLSTSDQNERMYPLGKNVLTTYEKSLYDRSIVRSNIQWKTRPSCPNSVIACFCADLNVALNFHKSVISEFNLDLWANNRHEEFFKEFFKSRRSLLKVKKIRINVSDCSQALQMLPEIDPESLVKMDLKVRGGAESEEDMSRLYQMDQWKKANELVLSSPLNTIQAQYYTHFTKGEIHFVMLDLNALMVLRQAFMENSPNLDEFILRSYAAESSIFAQCLGEKLQIQDVKNVDVWNFISQKLRQVVIVTKSIWNVTFHRIRFVDVFSANNFSAKCK